MLFALAYLAPAATGCPRGQAARPPPRRGPPCPGSCTAAPPATPALQALEGLGGAPAPAWPFRGRRLFELETAVLRLLGREIGTPERPEA
jgi:hypothetical protein